ncbi:BrnA antitoxin family protein [Roseicyclus amphidinii]|uniref:BrnA antitoxin family protein n=1 Tax=Roseicyclus amphidinii TaxID=3034232 RepID=UPI0024E0E1F5|nr:BrnA antitoxin family protein [Roseicyclus sp. Amp-Y-6]
MEMSDKPLGPRQREHHYYMVDALRRFEWDMHQRIWLDQRIPVEWHDIATRRERDKIRLTLRVDADVVKWFRSMGPGYQPRMNDVLRAFMHAKLAGLLHGEETVEPFKENWQARQRMPEWGDTERERAERKAARERE